MENGKSFNQQSLECAWRQIHDILFHPGTGMVYDYVTSHDPNHRFDHLPSPEEIAAGFPNPCGWSTGMEDCALNGGILLDLMRFRGWENSVFAAKIAEGVIRCGTVHGQDGFIARGISPHDGKSCYSNSSRDQFTPGRTALSQEAFPRTTARAVTATPRGINSRWQSTGCGVF